VKILFNPIQLDESIHHLRHHLSALPSAIDTFLEGIILESAHYTIELEGKKAGFSAIYQETIICQFSLEPEYKRYGQKVFSALKGLEKVQAAFVPSCDEFFLSHALDEYKNLQRQAYFFASEQNLPDTSDCLYTLRQATKADAPYITSAHIFGDQNTVLNKLEKQEFYITHSDEDVVGCGIIEKNNLVQGKASIGMFVSEDHRQQGIGTATLNLLRAECQKQNLSPIAGCAYTNHASKRTLEKARMFTQTRLLKVAF